MCKEIQVFWDVKYEHGPSLGPNVFHVCMHMFLLHLSISLFDSEVKGFPPPLRTECLECAGWVGCKGGHACCQHEVLCIRQEPCCCFDAYSMGSPAPVHSPTPDARPLEELR